MFNDPSIKPALAGFTLIELLIVIGLATILASATIPVYGNLQVASQLNESSAQIVQLLRQARAYSVAGKDNSAYGVYFEENETSNDKVIFYKGNSYTTRAATDDLVIIIGQAFELVSTIADQDVNFSRATGRPSTTGKVTLSASGLEASEIAINEIGLVQEN